MSKKTKEERLRHPSGVDTNESEATIKKKQDVITKARNRLFNFDTLKSNKHLEVNDLQNKKGVSKSMTQTTLEYFFKHSPNKDAVYANSSPQNNHNKKPKAHKLQKQNSIGSYPIRIEVTDEDDEFSSSNINRNRPATVCVDKLDTRSDAEALALERPRKKLSFRVPEIMGGMGDNKMKNGKDKCGSYSCISKLVLAPPMMPGFPRNNSFNGVIAREPSMEDCDLEVRITVAVYVVLF